METMTMKRMGFSVALVAMVMAGVRSHRRTVVRFHQDLRTDHAQQVGFTPQHPDRGYVQNCAPGGTYYNASWSPKKIDPTSEVHMFVDFVSPMYFEKGKASTGLWYEGNPMASVKQEITCEEISQMITESVPSLALHLTCPIKKGQRLTGYCVFPNTQQFIGYDGNYKLKAQIWDDQGKELLCLVGDVDILPFF